jgi:hypothetical protein
MLKGRARLLCAAAILAVPAYVCATPILSVNEFDVQFGVGSYNLVGSSRSTLPWEVTGMKAVFSALVTSG